MAYQWIPTSEKPTLTLSGNMIILDTDNLEEHRCPAVITEFLNHMKWRVEGTHPDTKAQLFMKNDVGVRVIDNEKKELDLTEGYYYRWEEAVAYEHAKMMSIGFGE